MELGLRTVALSAVNTFEGNNSRKTCRETNTKSRSSGAPAVVPVCREAGEGVGH